MSGKLEKIVTVAALRFDGHRYMESVGRDPGDFRGLVEPLTRSLALHPDPLENFACLFALQRYLFKWGGEGLPESDRSRLAFHYLFLHLYEQATPRTFRHEPYASDWDAIPAKQRETTAAEVRRHLIAVNDAHLNWEHLNRLQLGRYAEYWVKMEFTRAGFEVYTSEVDDRGIDFVARRGVSYFAVQVKSVRGFNYVYFRKAHFPLTSDMIAAVVLFPAIGRPSTYLIPATAWQAPNQLLVSQDYAGKKSEPDWGLNLSMKNMPLLEEYRFELVADRLCARLPVTPPGCS